MRTSSLVSIALALSLSMSAAQPAAAARIVDVTEAPAASDVPPESHRSSDTPPPTASDAPGNADATADTDPPDSDAATPESPAEDDPLPAASDPSSGTAADVAEEPQATTTAPPEAPPTPAAAASEATATTDAQSPASEADDGIPSKLPRLQVAGWWSIFSAITLGTAAGVVAGFAQRESDQALRLATRVDTEAGRQLLYADYEDEYEDILRRGRQLDTATITLGVLAGATGIAAITLFIVDAQRRHRRARKQPRTRAHALGWEVRF